MNEHENQVVDYPHVQVKIELLSVWDDKLNGYRPLVITRWPKELIDDHFQVILSPHVFDTREAADEDAKRIAKELLDNFKKNGWK